MRRTVTVLTHRRPHYLGQTLDALERCHGLDGWRVLVVLDRPDAATWSTVRRHSWGTVELDLRNAGDEPYARVSRATLMALALGFATADFVVHLEEDCVPAPDFLEFMAAMADRYRDDQRVFTVSGWWGGDPAWDEEPPVGALQAVGLEPWFVPWGWGTWRGRFDGMRAGWDLRYWDRSLNEVIRGDRLTVHPEVSRIRDIGAGGGVTGHEEWFDRYRRTAPAFAANAPAGGWA